MSEAASIAGPLADHLFRHRAGQIVAYLTRLLGPEHLDLAQEAVQEALLRALQQWPHSGIPGNPEGWLFRVARNAALDRIRHHSLAEAKTGEVLADVLLRAETEHANLELEARLRDDELQMVLMCCHPTLPRDARVALSLKTVGGFSVREIARAFLADQATIAQRLVRAKRHIQEQGLRFEMPKGEELAARLDAALEVIYLMFNEGYAAQSGEDLVRHELCGEALRLGELLASSSVAAPEVHALVALMSFQAARLPARLDHAGEIVLLEDQDRDLWDRRLIALGYRHFERCAEGERLTPYHLQAAIAATYARAQSRAQGEAGIDWQSILDLYDQLAALNPSPVVLLNRAVVLSRVQGAEAALRALEPLENDRTLRHYYLLPAVQAHLLRETGRLAAAAECYRRALECPCSEPERRLLKRKLAECA